MWLPVMLLALMASSSACPDLCECRRKSGPSGSPVFTDVVCNGRAPGLSELPAETRRLFVNGADESQVASLLKELEVLSRLDGFDESSSNSSAANGTTRGLPCLDELAVTNCSLASLNISWLGLERMRALNLSCNDLASLSDAQVDSMINLTRLMNLDFSQNLLTDISANSFRTLAGLTRLTLKRNAIATVHEDAFHGLDQLESLDLSDNRLSDLPDSALTSLYSLQKLDLSGNQLQVLGARLFESLDRLRELDVSRNGLARAAPGALQPLPGLSVLRLAENPLKERDVSLLLGTGRKLETVDASHTGLARVPAALTRSVRTLRLAGNKLTIIRGGDLDSYPLLRTLDISDNLLVDVEDDALGRLEVLEELNVSGNALVNIPRSLPNSLTHLDLRRNAITALRFSDTQGLYNLKCLILNDNDISEIEEGSLGQLPVLTELDLSDNPIKALAANALTGPSNLATLRMSGLSLLQWERQMQGDMTFPLPSPERLVVLDVSRSPVLVGQFLADDATLSACKSLRDLNLAGNNLTTLRSDLTYKLPQLQRLELADNGWNCTEDLYWLGDWIRHHKNEYHLAQCSLPQQLLGTFLHDLPVPRDPLPAYPPTTTLDEPSTMEPTIYSSTFNIPASSRMDNISMSSSVSWNESTESSGDIEHSVSVSTKGSEGNIRDARTEAISSKSAFSTVATTAMYPIYEAPTSFRNATKEQQQQQQQQQQVTLRKSKSPRNEEKIDIESRKTAEGSAVDRNSSKYDGSTGRGGTVSLPIIVRGSSNLQSSDSRVDGTRRKQKSERLNKLDASRSKIVPSKSTSSKVGFDRERKKGLGNYLTQRNNLTKENLIMEDSSSSNTIAEEFSGRATDSGAQVSESLSAGTHPGMLVLTGAALGAAAALTVVLSRRATIRRRERYHRHENIEVHTLTPAMELW
ncbi:insulin-like growth factor-binding protein complex acid labile subunit [Prorops nasuta]|uniref:insulin-like growth factor-binding protein complex acid labile subunit n=1 Tax=Prorops nasuta TaxID=863751 RepID=UPI0034CD49B8